MFKVKVYDINLPGFAAEYSFYQEVPKISNSLARYNIAVTAANEYYDRYFNNREYFILSAVLPDTHNLAYNFLFTKNGYIHLHAEGNLNDFVTRLSNLQLLR